MVNEDIKNYIDKLIDDESHIANKLHQTIQFINNYDRIKERVGLSLNNTDSSLILKPIWIQTNCLTTFRT